MISRFSSPVLFLFQPGIFPLSCALEQTLDANEDQVQDTNADPRPPETKGTVELQDGYDCLVDQYPQ
jgi:hypothetical protein